MPKVRYLFILFQLACFEFSFCQGLGNSWILGYDSIQNIHNGRTVIDFITGTSSIGINNHLTIPFLRTSASICDSSGSLLFFTNGFDVCNRFGSIMPNGQGISMSSELNSTWYDVGMPLSQAALILPQPGNDSLYYLFHETKQPYFIDTAGVAVYYPSCLYYSVINMNSDSSRGDLVVREQSAFADTLTQGRITAVKHANGRDWWIIVYRYEGDSYIKTLLTPSGLQAPIYQNIGLRLRYIDLGQAVFNLQGNKYAIADAFNGLMIMDFDRCTGGFSNAIQIHINDSSNVRGVAFSPSGQYLYVSGVKYLYQFDIWSSNIAASQTTVAIWDGFYSPSTPLATTFYSMQVAYDGKIYVNAPNTVKVMHRIDYPDSAGVTCSVCQHCLPLPMYNAFTMPNVPNYFLGADSGSVCDTLQLNAKPNYSLIKNEIKSFPNPVADQLTISYTPSEKVQLLEIYDVDGKMQIKQNIPQWSQMHKLDVSGLRPGIYLCRVKNNKMCSSCKFVKT